MPQCLEEMVSQARCCNVLNSRSFSVEESRSYRILVRLILMLAGIHLVSPFQLNTRLRTRTSLELRASKNSTQVDSTVATSGTLGQWEEMQGNYLLRPPLQDGPPRALLHFLGGAIVGSAPHIAYRYLLESLAAEGYLIVATPFALSFDHLTTCDDVIERFERIAKPLAQTYGALPVVGVGHSCGALLQLLITSLFPDTPRAANVLISYSNKPVTEAVPFFEEIVIPFFTYVAARNETSRPAGAEVIRVWLDLAKVSAKGELPSDELIAKVAQAMVPQDLANIVKPTFFPIPPILRTTLRGFSAPWTQALSSTEFLPLTLELLESLQQIPKLIDEVADGAREIIPPKALVEAAARRSYRARRTLLIQYTEDPLDESNDVEELLDTAGRVVRMKRPLIEIDVQRRNMTGGHSTPLMAPPGLDLAVRAETLLGPDVAKETLFYAQADRTVKDIVRWLEESNL